MPKISFILPIYNVATYLDKCILSLLNQGLNEDEIEIILVNDGSKDSSLSICTRYANQNPSVIVIDKENGGVGIARNAGIDIATGDYICFVDPDDYLNPGSMRFLLDSFPIEKYDLIRYWSRIIGERDSETFVDSKGEIIFKGSSSEYISKYGIDTFCWNYLYNRHWLRRVGIRFMSYRNAQDFLFIGQILLSKPNLLSTNCLVYNYVKHKHSATGDRSSNRSRIGVESFMMVYKSLYSFAKQIDHENNSNYLPYVVEAIQKKMRSFFSRILTSNLTVSEMQEMSNHLSAIGIIPISYDSNRRKQNVFVFIFNKCMANPSFILLIRPLYKFFFIPFILPLISKN